MSGYFSICHNYKQKGGKGVEDDIGSMSVLNEQCNSQVTSTCTSTELSPCALPLPKSWIHHCCFAGWLSARLQDVNCTPRNRKIHE